MIARKTICFLLLLFATVAVGQQKPAKPVPNRPGTDKPSLARIEPRGVQRGIATKVRLVGTNLAAIKTVKAEKLAGKIEVTQSDSTNAWVVVTPAKDLARGSYELSVISDAGESDRVKLFVDDIEQISEAGSDPREEINKIQTPCSFWGVLNPPADSDAVEFHAKTGDRLVFDVSAKAIGSKANINLSVSDSTGKLVTMNNNFDGGDPLAQCVIPATGTYRVHISEEQMGGSPDHFYRLTIGSMPVVTGCHPLSVRTNAQAEVFLTGYNLPQPAVVRFSAPAVGDVEVPVDTEKYRVRKAIKVLATDLEEIAEVEPNDSYATAARIPVPSVVGGRIWAETPVKKGRNRIKIGGIAHDDVDLYRFEAQSNEVWTVETDASRRGSPVDTKLEILHADGRPVDRLLLQAVRDSQINFRAIDSMTGDVRVDNWEEMELNELMYLEGEVCKIFRMPEGPDSGFQFYRNGGKRICYFNTSAAAHANGSSCYIVQPHPLGTRLVPNGLPVFTLDFSNDDDGERELGLDSRIQFTAPETGRYLIRVSDSRGHEGQHFSYRLILRRAQPDFQVTVNNPNPTVMPGSGTEFSVIVDRIDDFDGDIRVDIEGLPEGFTALNPLIIEAGHLQANGTLCAAADAKQPSKESLAGIRMKASARVNGHLVTKDLGGFKQIKLGDKPKLLVAIEPYDETNSAFVVRTVHEKPQEITIEPGSTVPAWLKIQRHGHEELVTFTVENLPHGVIVDNIGLNGVLIPKGENERQIFLRCAKWVGETDRLTYCQARQAGNPTSAPILIKVRKPAAQQSAAR